VQDHESGKETSETVIVGREKSSDPAKSKGSVAEGLGGVAEA